MQVSAFISLAKKTVLRQLNVVDEDLLDFINFGLLELYKKFPISIKEFNIPVSPNINIYILKKDCMVVQAAFTDKKYLEGDFSSEEDIIEIPLNDENDKNSIYTPEQGKLLVPYPKESQIISLLYRATPVIIEQDEVDNFELELAPQYHQALLFYIAHLYQLAYANDTTAEQDKYFQKFIMECESIKVNGLVAHQDNTSNTKFENRGWI